MKRYTTTPELSIGFLDFMLMLAKNPFNHVGMTQKLPYIPILVGLGPKLWPVTLKLCQRAYSSAPFFQKIHNFFKKIYNFFKKFTTFSKDRTFFFKARKSPV